MQTESKLDCFDDWTPESPPPQSQADTSTGPCFVTWGDNCAYFLACCCLLLRLLGVGGGRGGEDNNVLCSTFLVSALFQDMLLHDVCTGRGVGRGGG